MSDDSQMNDMLNKVRDMQENMQKQRAKLDEMEFLGEAGAGMVIVVFTGNMVAKRIDIDPELYNQEPEVLQNLLIAAINSGLGKVEAACKNLMQGVAQDINDAAMSSIQKKAEQDK